jgi:hypothetical protein
MQEAPPAEQISDDGEPPDTWRRVEIGPGIELHVHAAALTGTAIERLRGMLLQELGVLRGWFPDKEK